MTLQFLRRLNPITRWRRHPTRVAVIRLSGVIGPRIGRLRAPSLSIETLAGALERAFSMKGLAAVALVINSPGGSPVQSSLIAGRIRALAAEKDVPVLAFAEDVAASGGYWLACAADEIFADNCSIIGSIGVVAAGFGFHELLERCGVERRLHTAGDRKVMLDPFSPEDGGDVAYLKLIQDDIHNAFKEMVRTRRGARLATDEAELFSGAFWTGRRAVELGLIDGIDDLRSVLRRRFGNDVRIVPVNVQRSWFRPRIDAAIAPSPEGLVDGVLAAVSDRARWSRFGL